MFGQCIQVRLHFTQCRFDCDAHRRLRFLVFVGAGPVGDEQGTHGKMLEKLRPQSLRIVLADRDVG